MCKLHQKMWKNVQKMCKMCKKLDNFIIIKYVYLVIILFNLIMISITKIMLINDIIL